MPTEDSFAALATHLDALAETVTDHISQGHTWLPDSPAALEVEHEPHTGWWGERPALNAALAPTALLLHAEDHLRALAAAVRAPQVVLATLSLIRPCLESTSLAYYLLEDVPPLERIRRVLNMELRAKVEGATMMRASTEKQWADCPRRHDRPMMAGALHRNLDRIYWIGREAERHGLPLRRGRSRDPRIERPAWIGDQPPRDQTLLTALLDDVGVADLGPMYHRLTSSVVHAQQHGLQLFLGRDTPTDTPGVHLGEIGHSLGDLARHSAAVVYGLHRTMLRACTFYGWDGQPWLGVAMPALEDWRRWIAAPPLRPPRRGGGRRA